MKKKFIVVLASIFMLVSCVMFSACGDKYKNLTFKVEYAIGEDMNEWFDASDGISLSYGTNGKLKIDGDENISSVFLRVTVGNVKAKNIGKVVVSPSNTQGLTFSEKIINSGEYFEIEILGNIQTSLTVYESNSGKSTSIAFSVCQSLERIDADLSLAPAMTVGSAINLPAINNISYYPLNKTNEIGVSYEVVSVGSFNENKDYIPLNNPLKEELVEIENGKLNLSDEYELTLNNYALKINATSNFYENLSTSFYVYIVEAIANETPIAVNSKGISLDLLDLYENNPKYSQMTLTVNMSGDFRSIYESGVYTSCGRAYYDFNVYVGVKNTTTNSYYDFGSMSQNVNGLYITKYENSYTVKIAASSFTEDNTLSFVYNVMGLDFSFMEDSVVPNYKKDITVKRHTLPKYIQINGNSYENGDNYDKNDKLNESLYSYGGINKSKQLIIAALPNDSSSEKIVLTRESASLLLYDQRGVQLSCEVDNPNKFIVKTGSIIYVKFDTNSTDSSATLKLSVYNAPDSFNGEDVTKKDTINVTIKFNNLKTLSESPEVYGNESCTESDVLISAGQTGCFYIKVKYVGTFDPSTVVFTLPETSAAAFNGNIKKTFLSNEEFVTTNVYKIQIVAGLVAEDVICKIAVGDLYTKEFKIQIKNVLPETTTFEIKSSSQVAYNVSDITNGHTNYAIEKGKTAEFDVTYLNGLTKGIEQVKISKEDTSAYSPDNFNSNSVSYSVVGNQFSLSGEFEKTALLKVLVSFYKDEGGKAVLQTKEIYLDVAVFKPVAQILLQAEKSTLTYLNSKYVEASSTKVNYNSLASDNAAPTSVLYFSSNNTPTIGSITPLTMSNISTLSIKCNYMAKEGLTLTQDSDLISETSPLALQGSFVVSVGKDYNFDVSNLTLTLTPATLGQTKSLFGSCLVNVVEVEKSTGINFDTDVMTQIGNGYDINLSHISLTKEGDEDKKEFSITAGYDTENSGGMRFGDLCFSLYQYNVNDDGTIVRDGNGNLSKMLLLENKETGNISNKISVAITNGKVSVKTSYGTEGGKYLLVVSTWDSYDDNGTFKNSVRFNINVGDGSEKYKYTISNSSDFEAIQSNLTKHFVLAADIELEEKIITGEFEGSLTGLYESNNTKRYYSISYTIGSHQNDKDLLCGLFEKTTENAKISNLTVHATLSSESSNFYKNDHSEGNLIMGALVAINEGAISNVNVNISSVDTSLSANVSIYFGGIVGQNNARINASTVNTKELKFTADAKNVYIAGMVGKNTGTIEGGFSGDFNTLSFDAIINISVTKTTNKQGNNRYIAGVCADSTGGEIKNLLISGDISINKADGDTEDITGYLAGAVAIGGAVDNVNTLCMTLTSDCSGVDVAGLVGQATGDIENSKVVFAVADFNGANDYKYGDITGANIVAGLVADLNGMQSKYCTVETFNNQSKISGGVVYGLAGGSGTITSCFVKAELSSTGNVYLTSNNTETNTYFIGKFECGDSNSVTINSNYAVDTENGKFTVDKTNFLEMSENMSGLPSGADWGTDKGYNTVKFGENTYDLPYLVKDKKPLQIIAPESVTAEQNDAYIDIIFGDVLDLTKTGKEIKEKDKYEITKTAVINYHDSSENRALEYNTYNLINTSTDEENPNGLIDINVLPAQANAGLCFQIVGGGYHYAYITKIGGLDKIVFTGCSVDTPIVVRAYSAFNQEAEAYFAFYTQIGLSSLVLDATNISKVENYYQMNLYVGETKTIKVSAENIFEGIKFDSIISRPNLASKYTLSYGTSDEYLNITQNGTNFVFSIKDDKINALPTDPVEVKFSLKLIVDGTEYDYSDVTIKLTLCQSAKSITISKSNNDYEEPTNGNFVLEARLLTSFVDKDNLGTISNEIDLQTNSITAKTDNGDSIRLSIECMDEDQSEFQALLNRTSSTSAIELFSFDIDRFYAIENENYIGYDFVINYALLDEDNYRYIQNPIKFRVKINATSMPSISDTFTFTLKPTVASTVRIESYTINKINVESLYSNIVSKSELQTSMIDPSGVGNIFAIYIEPSYSNVESVVLKSSELYVPSLNKNVNLMFTQFALDGSGKLVSLFGLDANTQSNSGDHEFNLKLISKKDGSDTSYNGVLYVRVQVEKFSGLESVLTASLEVVCSDGENQNKKTVYKNLLTQYLPGAQIAYQTQPEYEVSDGYLVQEGSYGNVAKIKVWGYQFNSNPLINPSWYLSNGSSFIYKHKKKLEIYSQYDFLEYVKEHNLSFVWAEKDSKTYRMTAYESGYTYYSISNMSVIEDSEGRQYLIGDYVNYHLLNTFDDVEYNLVDDSYSMNLDFSVSADIVAPFAFTASLDLVTKAGQIEKAESRDIVFYPTDYLLKSIRVVGTTDNYSTLAIGRSRKLEFSYETELSIDKTASINDKLWKDFKSNPSEILKYFTYSVDNQKFDLSRFIVDNSDNPMYIKVDSENKQFVMYGNNVFNNTINISLPYAYTKNADTGKYELDFKANIYDKNYYFKLYIHEPGTEENATPVYSWEQMFDIDGNCLLGEGGHYILMNDITLLDNITPITTKIGSLDGNNHVIKITGFKVNTNSGNYGLFASLSGYETIDNSYYKSILKNVIVDYSEFNMLSLTNVNVETINFGGLVAVNEGGLIYNCDVINIDPTEQKEINIIVPNADVNVVAGLLIGSNDDTDSIVTNSRVGRASYTRIVANSKTGIQSEYEINLGPIKFSVYSESVNVLANIDGQLFHAQVGGFVGVNSGIISSSYIANTTVINHSNSISKNETAGFVANNSGNITYSYVKAQTNDYTNVQLNRYSIEHKGNGSVAGFVYENSGYISNAYSNIELITQSANLAGFVYSNAAEGVIEVAYSACVMNKKIKNGQDDNSEQPFVGVNASNELLSDGQLKNCYYLLETGKAENVSKAKAQAVALYHTNFLDTENLNGFMFVDSQSLSDLKLGSWSFYDVNTNKKYKLPELTAPNQIAHSLRYLTETKVENENVKYIYQYASKYEQGLETNPYIVRNAEEYNAVFATNNNVFSGYVRFIDNIDFAEQNVTTKTRTNFCLGSDVIKEVTLIEGNGMKISGIYLDAQETTQIESVGLFAEIRNAYVKNLHLYFPELDVEIEHQFSTSSAVYSGGLAGKIHNSTLINISVEGGSTVLVGQNLVGGIAGIITGDSTLMYLTSAINVNALSENGNNIYYSETDYKKLLVSGLDYFDYIKTLSYAGGIAGVLDINKGKSNFNVYNLETIGSTLSALTNRLGAKKPNIIADYAGGIAGYMGRNVSAIRLKYTTGVNEYIYGRKVVGGLVAVSMSEIVASQVTAKESLQYYYDTEFAQYVMMLASTESASAELDLEKIGNIALLQTNKDTGISGGLVGYAIASKIKASYAKASFEGGITIGGLVGKAMTTKISYSYAVPIILDSSEDEEDTKFHLEKESQLAIGGLIGEAFKYDAKKAVTEMNVYEKLLRSYTDPYVNSGGVDIQFTFSTLLTTIDMAEKLGSHANYVCGKNSENLTSIGTDAMSYVFIGEIEYGSATFSGLHSGVHNKKLDILYNVDASEQTSLFNDIFAGWSSVGYWSLNPAKYFPLLLDQNVKNFIEIHNWDELVSYLNADPTGNYKIVNDINAQAINGNWVIIETFSGILLGEKPNTNEAPVISGIEIDCDSDDTAGFFKETSGATISNIVFEYKENGININGKNITHVSGLACENVGDDKETLITGVTVKSTGVVTNEDSLNIEGAKTIVGLTSGETISGVAGIIYNAKNVNIVSSYFVGNITATLKDDSGDVVASGIAGIMSKSNKAEGAEATDNEEVLASTLINCEAYAILDITIITIKEAVKSIYVSTLVGRADYSAISGSIVSDKSSLTIKNDSPKQLYVGGIVAYATDTPIIASESQLSGMDVITYSTSNLVGGLAGYYVRTEDSGSGIERSNSKTAIKVNSNSALYVSGGIAQASGEGLKIAQCVFAGSIDTTSSSLTTVYAGGAIAVLDDAISEGMQEIMTSVDMIVGSSSATTVCAGGIIGYTKESISIAESMTTGRIVPITAEADVKVNIGGVIGLVGEDESDITLTDVVCLSSIITDSINPAFYISDNSNDLIINAVVGLQKKVKSFTCSNVYYSSDISLCTQIGIDGITNFSGYIFSNKFYSDLIVLNSGCWGKTSNGAPRIISLGTSLASLGMIVNDNYKPGSVLNPKLVTGTTKFESDEFTYYIVDSTIPSGKELMNGFVMAKDGINPQTITNNMFTEIDKHSVVSNFHLKLNETGHTIDGTGIIAKTNNGVIFNCTVAGDQVNAAGKTFALITDTNKGVIDTCYSSIEIAQSKAVYGIANNNESTGLIKSCFFTGYINSTGYSYAMAKISNGYMVSCYNGGVIENFSCNSLVNNNDIENVKEVYIDKYANFDAPNKDVKIKWVTTSDMKSMGGFTDWESKPEYNYGYKYPNLQKYGYNNLIISNTYVRYTGTGDASSDTQNFEITDLARRCNMLSGDGYSSNYYNKALKVPHLGILTTLTSNAYYSAHKDINAVLIYNVNMRDKSYYTGKDFTGLFISNKYYNKSSDKCTIKNISSPIFSNLSSSEEQLKDEAGNNIGDPITHDVYIANIQLGNLSASSVFGNVVNYTKGSEEKPTTVTVNNISYSGAEYTGSSGAGLFGTINASGSKTSIVNIQSYDATDLKVNTNGSFAYVADTIGNANVTFDSESILTVQSDTSKTATSIVGVANTIKNGATVDMGSSTLEIGTVTSTNIAGVALNIENGATVKDVNLTISGLINANFFGGIFGTVKGATAQSGTSDAKVILDGITKITIDSNVTIKGLGVTSGLIAASMETSKDDDNPGTLVEADVAVSNLCVTTGSITLTDSNGSEGAVGTFVGKLNGNLTITMGENGNALYHKDAAAGTSEDIVTSGFTLISNGISNVGGVAGIYYGGTCKINNFGVVKVQGNANNVGGLFGSMNLNENSNVDISGLTLITHAEVYSSPDKTGYSNFGGVVGKITNDASNPCTNSIELTNCNSVIINGTNANMYNTITVSNIGGVVGYVSGKLNLSLTNSSSIQVDANVYLTVSNVGGVAGWIAGDSKDTSIITDNSSSASVCGKNYVGGSVGYLSNATLNLTGLSGAVSGVSNVGGIVGYSDASSIVGTTDEEAVISTDVTGNYCVGGFIGNSKDSTVNNLSYTGTVEGIDYTANDRTYIPTNIGGVFGSATGSTIQNCSIAGATIKVESSTPDEKENYVGDGSYATTTNKTEVTAMESGIGGIAGSVDVGTLNNSQNDYLTFKKVTVYAKSGLSVGILYGYQSGAGSFANSTTDISAQGCTLSPTFDGESSVDGRFYVGGLVGRIDTAGEGMNSRTLKGEGTINVQKQTNATYVGGLFGQVCSDSISDCVVDNENAKVKINIGKETKYSGGLVGTLQWNCSSATINRCQVSSDSKTSGTFVGLIDYSDYPQCTLEGKSEYMIGTIRAKFSGKESTNSVLKTKMNSSYQHEFYAIATETFDWCQLSGLYVGVDRGTADEYTRFRNLERKYTGTDGKEHYAGLLDLSSIVYYQTENDVYKNGSNEILYTICKLSSGSYIMYSKIGIARSHAGTNDDGDACYTEPTRTGSVRYIDANYSENKTDKEHIMQYFDWKQKYYTLFSKADNDKTDYINDSGVEKRVAYAVEAAKIVGVDLDKVITDNKMIYFVFDCIFENNTTSGTYEGHKVSTTDDNLPYSGSIFDACGVTTSDSLKAHENNWDDNPTLAARIITGIIGGIIFVALAVSVVLTGGASIGAIACAVVIAGGGAVATVAAVKYAGYAASVESEFINSERHYFITSSYTRELIYSGGKYIDTYDQIYSTNNKAYIPYSTEKPSDYNETDYIYEDGVYYKSLDALDVNMDLERVPVCLSTQTPTGIQGIDYQYDSGNYYVLYKDANNNQAEEIYRSDVTKDFKARYRFIFANRGEKEDDKKYIKVNGYYKTCQNPGSYDPAAYKLFEKVESCNIEPSDEGFITIKGTTYYDATNENYQTHYNKGTTLHLQSNNTYIKVGEYYYIYNIDDNKLSETAIGYSYDINEIDTVPYGSDSIRVNVYHIPDTDGDCSLIYTIYSDGYYIKDIGYHLYAYGFKTDGDSVYLPAQEGDAIAGTYDDKKGYVVFEKGNDHLFPKFYSEDGPYGIDLESGGKIRIGSVENTAVEIKYDYDVHYYYIKSTKYKYDKEGHYFYYERIKYKEDPFADYKYKVENHNLYTRYRYNDNNNLDTGWTDFYGDGVENNPFKYPYNPVILNEGKQIYFTER